MEVSQWAADAMSIVQRNQRFIARVFADGGYNHERKRTLARPETVSDFPDLSVATAKRRQQASLNGLFSPS
jgi:hypothetical protein